MDFDHREGADKRFNVSAGIVYGFAIETIREEADKCDVVCSNCHRLRTLRRTESRRLPVPPAAPPMHKRTHCPQGHPYEGENLRVRARRGGISRECVICVRDGDRKRYRDKRRRVNRGSE